MTNNVESCKKINGRVQTFRFSVFTMGRQELCAENAKKTPKLEKLKRKLKRYDLSWVVPCERAHPEDNLRKSKKTPFFAFFGVPLKKISSGRQSDNIEA